MWCENQLPMLREYIGKNTYNFLLDACLDFNKLTFDNDYLRNIRYTRKLQDTETVYRTIFKEVKVKKPIVPEINYWPNVGDPIKRLKDILEKDWVPEKFHLFFHSSGYDTRLLSWILVQLREKYGWGFIGDILFLCFEPEGEAFTKIMEVEGWKRNQYHVYKEGETIDYRSELIDFKNVWKGVNHCYAIPTIVANPSVEDAFKRGLIPSEREIHVIGGLFGNESKEINDYSASGFVEKYGVRHIISSLWSTVAFQGFKMPYLDLRLGIIQNRNIVLKHIPKYPEKKLHEIPIWACHDSRLSENIREKAARDFSNSWYAKEKRQEADIAPNLTQNKEWWRNYVLASLIEKLRENDVKILIELRSCE